MLQSILYGLKKKVWVLLFYYLNVFVVLLKLTGELLKYSCASLPPPLVLVSMAVLGSVFLWRARAWKSCRRRCFSAPLLEILTARLNVEEVSFTDVKSGAIGLLSEGGKEIEPGEDFWIYDGGNCSWSTLSYIWPEEKEGLSWELQVLKHLWPSRKQPSQGSLGLHFWLLSLFFESPWQELF